MVKRWLSVLLVVALLLALTAVLWARAAQQPARPQSSVSTRSSATMGQPGTQVHEHTRCTKTCNTVMPYYQQKYTSLKSHDGDKECYKTCWDRYGDKNKKNASVADQRKLWMAKNPQNLRANQCAQACWRKYHGGEMAQATINVAGYRSEPRAWAAGTESGPPTVR